MDGRCQAAGPVLTGPDGSAADACLAGPVLLDRVVAQPGEQEGHPDVAQVLLEGAGERADRLLVRRVQTDEDTTAGFNRSEHLRQLPPDTKAYARTYGRRPPAESDNSQRERRYAFQRIPAYGHEQQALVVLLGSFLDNSKSRYLHQRRQRAEQQAA